MDARMYSYNIKVYPHDWFVAIKDISTDQGRIYHNNSKDVIDVVTSRAGAIFGTWGGKFYEQFIMKAIYAGFSPEQIYELHKYLQAGKRGWDYPALSKVRWRFQDTDLADDTNGNLTVPVLAGHLGFDIPVYTVPEDESRPLNEGEIQSIITTMKKENNVVTQIMKIRDPYLSVKETLGNMANIGLNGLHYTNAKLCSVLLGAKKRSYNDARNYKYPETILHDYIPQQMFDFINKLYDESLSDDEVFKNRRVVLVIGGCEITIANGGIHGAIPNYDSANIPEGRVLVILDASSFYPSEAVNNGYISRSIPPERGGVYANIVANRKEAKRNGIKKVANALKTVVNTYFGSLLAPTNDLYDPLMGRSIVYTGQLHLIELLNHLATDIPELKVVMGNTDGFTIEINEKDRPLVDAIVKEFQERTKLTLEEDTNVQRIIQKNVNNYVEVREDGTLKVVGELHRGVEQEAMFRCNNNAPIVCNAVIENIINGTPVEQTIGDCTNIKEFQYIANASNGVRCFTMFNGQQVDVNLVNRIYAAKDTSSDTIYYTDAKGVTRKVSGLPEHCVIDNANKLSISDIDLDYYIEIAKKLASTYLQSERTVEEPVLTSFFQARSEDLNVPHVDIDALKRGEKTKVRMSEETYEAFNKYYRDKFFSVCDRISIKEYLLSKGCSLRADGGWWIIEDFGVDSVKLKESTNTIHSFGSIVGHASNVYQAAKFLRSHRGEDTSFKSISEELISIFGADCFPDWRDEFEHYEQGGSTRKLCEPAVNNRSAVFTGEMVDELKGHPELPDKDVNDDIAMKYLCEDRMIDPDIAKFFFDRGDMYGCVKESHFKDHFGRDRRTVNHNVAFLGKDKDGNVRACEVKYTQPYMSYDKDANGDRIPKKNKETGEVEIDSNGNIVYRQHLNKSNSVAHSDKAYSFSYIPDGAKTIRCFEATIDALSWLSLCKIERGDDSWKNYAFLVLEGVGKNWESIPNGLIRVLNENPDIIKVITCFDNDEVGLGAANTLAQLLTQPQEQLNKPYYVSKSFAKGKNCKDWNDTLKAVRNYLRQQEAGLGMR